jgi:hypothetical protein
MSGAKSGRKRLRERRWKNSHSHARNGCGNTTANGNMLLFPAQRRPEIPPMDDLIARLESLFSRYAAALDQRQGDGAKLAHQFRKDLSVLVAEYGQPAIDAALGDLPQAGIAVSVSALTMSPFQQEQVCRRFDRTSCEKGFLRPLIHSAHPIHSGLRVEEPTSSRWTCP